MLTARSVYRPVLRQQIDYFVRRLRDRASSFAGPAELLLYDLYRSAERN